MKKILKLIFIGIPNIPLIIIIWIYVIYNIFKHNSIVEIVMYMENNEDFATSEIKSHIGKLFPKMLFRGIALYFWMYVLSQAIT
jgi:hypothetical protein